MVIQSEDLRSLACAIFVATGSDTDEATIVVDHLVEANLCGHDSHGVGLIPTYIRDRRDGYLHANGVMRSSSRRTASSSLRLCRRQRPSTRYRAEIALSGRCHIRSPMQSRKGGSWQRSQASRDRPGNKSFRCRAWRRLRSLHVFVWICLGHRGPPYPFCASGRNGER